MILFVRCVKCHSEVWLKPTPEAPFGRMPDKCPSCGRTDTKFNLGVEAAKVQQGSASESTK